MNEPSTTQRQTAKPQTTDRRTSGRSEERDKKIDAENEEPIVVAGSQTGDGQPTIISTEDVRQGRRGENVSIILALSLAGAAGALAFVLFFFII